MESSLGAGWQVEPVGGDRRFEAEQELVASGLPVPFSYRFHESTPIRDLRLMLIRDGSGHCVGGMGTEFRRIGRTAHVSARVLRFGSTVPPEIRDAALEYLHEMVNTNHRVLRCALNVFSLDGEEAQRIGRTLEAAGWIRSPETDGYQHTLVVDLEPEIDAIYASLHRSARRNIRELDKQPVNLATIEDARFVERMHELSRETFARTGGVYQPVDWQACIDYSRNNPTLARMVGLFRDNDPSPEALLAFAWGQSNGDHASYADGASTANPGTRIAMSYPLLWDLISWAKGWGAVRFDMGGVTVVEGDDPLAGISSFKRYFTTNVVEASSTWVLPPRSVRARVANSARSLLNLVRG